MLDVTRLGGLSNGGNGPLANATGTIKSPPSISNMARMAPVLSRFALLCLCKCNAVETKLMIASFFAVFFSLIV